MSTDVDNYLAHLGVEVDSELKHYGKKGMKWGQRKNGEAVSDKKLSRMNRSADRGDARIAKSKKGTSESAALSILGREAARQVLLTVGANIAVNLSKDPRAKVGIAVVSNLVATGSLIKGVRDFSDVNKSANRTDDRA